MSMLIKLSTWSCLKIRIEDNIIIWRQIINFWEGRTLQIFDMIWFNRNWVDTQWQQYSSHLHTNNTHNTENGRYITIKKLTNLGRAGTTQMNQNFIQEEIKSKLKSGNACYHSVQNLLSSSLLSKNRKIKMYGTIILSGVLFGVKIGLAHWGRNVVWGCLRIGCWGRYVSLSGTR
jgi:hypothetical protein